MQLFFCVGTLDLSSNRLSGEIPSTLGQLVQIQNLKIERNDFTGDVPLELCFTDHDPIVRADCREVSCPCCTECCIDGDGCDDVKGKVTPPPLGSPSVPAPTQKPVTPPTRSPITPATPAPVTAPQPVSSPTKKPTSPPVTPVTPAPVTVSTPVPTKKPTLRPTTKSPTGPPIPLSTPLPTDSPTRKPTRSPIASDPTPFPVDATTSEPTPGVTEEPASVPTPTAECFDSLTANKLCYENGDDIIFSFDNCQPRADDWVGIYHISTDKSFLREPIAWVWGCGDQFCQEEIAKGQVTFYSVQGRGRYIAYLVRQSNSYPYEAYAETEIFRVGDSCA